jgi:hypothetical protein
MSQLDRSRRLLRRRLRTRWRVLERVLPSGECLVLAVWKSGLFGKPGREEWTLIRYGTLGDETGPMTLHEGLSRIAALAGAAATGPGARWR